MCGIVGMISQKPVNQRIYDALLLLQHRGQDAAGIGTLDGLTCTKPWGLCVMCSGRAICVT